MLTRSAYDRYTDSIVQIHVGKGPVTTFNVHEDFLTRTSDFFKAAVEAEQEQSRTRSIELDQEDAEIFNVYVTWLYIS